MKHKSYWKKFKIIGWSEVWGSKDGRLVKTRIPIYKLIKELNYVYNNRA